MGDLLFVYGTLRRGSAHPMAAWLAGRADWLGQATVAGSLYRISYYPGLVPGPGHVMGDLFQLWPEGVADTWARLDAFEEVRGEAGDEYRRELTPMRMMDGQCVMAQAYWYQLPCASLSLIPDGDWLAQP